MQNLAVTCNAKQGNKVHDEINSNSIPRKDTLAQDMQMCKDTSSGGDAFIRSVEAASEPMCVLATNQQLVDLERFYTACPSSVLSVDPTFNLGPFTSLLLPIIICWLRRAKEITP